MKDLFLQANKIIEDYNSTAGVMDNNAMVFQYYIDEQDILTTKN